MDVFDQLLAHVAIASGNQGPVLIGNATEKSSAEYW